MCKKVIINSNYCQCWLGTPIMASSINYMAQGINPLRPLNQKHKIGRFKI